MAQFRGTFNVEKVGEGQRSYQGTRQSRSVGGWLLRSIGRGARRGTRKAGRAVAWRIKKTVYHRRQQRRQQQERSRRQNQVAYARLRGLSLPRKRQRGVIRRRR